MCCNDFNQALRDEVIVYMDMAREERYGRIMNTIQSEYYIRKEKSPKNYSYYGINFCPFCGKAVSLAAQGFLG